MSFCRFSTNDFQCDVYAYADVAGGITVHVAANRVIYKEPLPPEILLETDNHVAWVERHAKVMEMVEAAARESITAKHAGQSYFSLDIDSAVALLQELQTLGYVFPGYVIEDVQEEANAEPESTETGSSN